MNYKLILHRTKIVVYVSITLVLLMIDSIWKGIPGFVEIDWESTFDNMDCVYSDGFVFDTNY